MILIDVNILVYAHRPDANEHSRYLGWLEDALNSEEICGLSELALAGMVRIVTHPQIYPKPTPVDFALKFAEELRGDEGTVIVCEIVPGLGSKGQSRERRLFCRSRDRVGRRMDYRGSRLRKVSRPALAASAFLIIFPV
jgi:predicted nucleic acid-binding protein